MRIDSEPPHDNTLDPDWRMVFLDFLVRGVLPVDKVEARRVARRAKSYVVISGELYRRSPTKVLQRCIPIE